MVCFKRHHPPRPTYWRRGMHGQATFVHRSIHVSQNTMNNEPRLVPAATAGGKYCWHLASCKVVSHCLIIQVSTSQLFPALTGEPLHSRSVHCPNRQIGHRACSNLPTRRHPPFFLPHLQSRHRPTSLLERNCVSIKRLHHVARQLVYVHSRLFGNLAFNRGWLTES